MKYAKKWKVIPYEEKTESYEEKDLKERDNLKKILENQEIDESERYNLYNNNFKKYIDKKSNRMEDTRADQKTLSKINELENQLDRIDENSNKQKSNLGTLSWNLEKNTSSKIDKKIAKLKKHNDNEIKKIQESINAILENKNNTNINYKIARRSK